MSEVERSAVQCHQPCFNVTCILGRPCLGNSQRQDSWQTAISLYRNLLNIRERVHQHFAPPIPNRYFRNFIFNNKQVERPHFNDTICESSACSNPIPNLKQTISTDFKRDERNSSKTTQPNTNTLNEALKQILNRFLKKHHQHSP